MPVGPDSFKKISVLEMAGRQVAKCDQKSFGATSFGQIRVFVARRIMFGRPTLNLCMHSNNRVMSVQTGCTSLQFIL